MFGEFLGEAGAGKDANFVVVGQDFSDDLEGQKAGVEFEAFAGGEDGQVAVTGLFDQFDTVAQAGYGGNH